MLYHKNIKTIFTRESQRIKTCCAHSRDRRRAYCHIDMVPDLAVVIIIQSAFTAEIKAFILKTQLKHTVEFICIFWSKSS